MQEGDVGRDGNKGLQKEGPEDAGLLGRLYLQDQERQMTKGERGKSCPRRWEQPSEIRGEGQGQTTERPSPPVAYSCGW